MAGRHPPPWWLLVGFGLLCCAAGIGAIAGGGTRVGIDVDLSMTLFGLSMLLWGLLRRRSADSPWWLAVPIVFVLSFVPLLFADGHWRGLGVLGTVVFGGGLLLVTALDLRDRHRRAGRRRPRRDHDRA